MSAVAHAVLAAPRAWQRGNHGPGRRPHSPKPGVDGRPAWLLGPPTWVVSATVLAV